MNKDSDVKVTVCCAAYNHEKYIEQTILGFVSQKTDFRFEIIIHEDVSTDGTKAVIQKYADMYPELIVPIFQSENQYSKGRGMVNRSMFAIARGKYIAICEGDDYWTDEFKLQKQYDAMEAHPQCSMCVHHVKNIFLNGVNKKMDLRAKGLKSWKRFDTGVLGQEEIAKELWLESGYPFHTPSFFMRKTALKEWFNEGDSFNRHMNGDIALIRACLVHGDFFYINETMACRRRGVENSWSDKWLKSDIEKRIGHYKRLIDGERRFDEYSEYQFHDFIQIYIFNIIAECCIYDTTGIRQLIKENPIRFSVMLKKDSLWAYIRYLILRISPKGYKWLYDMREKSIRK